jgi:UDP:flavonoid glycosyltransferase YjiC (YdhE family)
LEFAASRGFPKEWLDGRAAIDVTFDFPELNLAPQELDFERNCTDLFYAGPCVELDRDESGRAPMPRLPADRPIVCFALGTQTQRYSNVVERIGLVASAARLLPDVHFVWAWNGDYEAAIPNLPDNFVQVSRAPQLALLRRASLMVTHGGLNSIKEALCFGVPLLVLPCDLDQPGNAARLEFHGYGRRSSWETTAAELAASIRAALNDDAMKKRVLKLSERFEFALANREAVQAFQRCLEHSLRFRKQTAFPLLAMAI